MPNCQSPGSQNHGRKLQAAKIDLVRIELPVETLGRLSEAETHANVQQNDGDAEHDVEGLGDSFEHDVFRFEEEANEEEDEEEEGGGLEGETTQEDAVRCRCVFSV